MRTDGRRRVRRPPGAVLRPLGLLAAAAMTSFGMWRALVADRAVEAPERLSRHDAHVAARLLHGVER